MSPNHSFTSDQNNEPFSQDRLDALFPLERTDAFFDALYGDVQEGAYTIRLVLEKVQAHSLHFAFNLHQRPGKCLVCNVTYGLPQVFMRHPIINVQGLVDALAHVAGWTSVVWKLGSTESVSTELYRIPLVLKQHVEQDVEPPCVEKGEMFS